MNKITTSSSLSNDDSSKRNEFIQISLNEIILQRRIVNLKTQKRKNRKKHKMKILRLNTCIQTKKEKNTRLLFLFKLAMFSSNFYLLQSAFTSSQSMRFESSHVDSQDYSASASFASSIFITYVSNSVNEHQSLKNINLNTAALQVTLFVTKHFYANQSVDIASSLVENTHIFSIIYSSFSKDKLRAQFFHISFVNISTSLTENTYILSSIHRIQDSRTHSSTTNNEVFDNLITFKIFTSSTSIITVSFNSSFSKNDLRARFYDISFIDISLTNIRSDVKLYHLRSQTSMFASNVYSIIVSTILTTVLLLLTKTDQWFTNYEYQCLRISLSQLINSYKSSLYFIKR